MKKSNRGGKRDGAGRKKFLNLRNPLHVRISDEAKAKLDALQLRSKSEFIDKLINEHF